MSTQPTRLTTPDPPWSRKSGMVLWVVTLVLAALAIVGTTVYSVAHIDVAMSSYYKKAVTAFYQADAGVRYVAKHIAADVDAGKLLLDDPVETVKYTAPAGFTFDPVTTLTRLPDGSSYLFTVTGRALDAQVTIEAVVVGGPKYPFGLFGGQSVKVSGTGSVVGDVGSNGNIQLSGVATIGGDATPGPGGMVDADPGDVTGSTDPATEFVVLDPVDPAARAAAMADNNNAAVAAFIDADGILIVEGQDVTMPEGTYYFTHVSVKDPWTLDVTGPVNIYCDGKFEIPGHIDNASARPGDLNIWIDGSEHIDFSGLDTYANVYAPQSNEAKLKSGAHYYGSMIVGGKVDIGDAHYTGMGPGALTEGIKLVSWKQL